MQYTKHSPFSSADGQTGFTLIEMLVIIAIIGFLSTVIIVNFSHSRVDLNVSINELKSNIRQAQSEAVSSAKYDDYNPCGYGIHYIDSTHYAIYVGPDADSNDCASIDHNYSSSEDSIVNTEAFTDSSVQIVGTFNDVFFQPPDPTTYLNDSSDLNQAPISITIGTASSCSAGSCATVYIYPSGNVDTQ